jgi:BlaI family penicillinase repressor
MESSRPPVSDAEREVLRGLWDAGPGTVRELQQRLAAGAPSWTRSTVITLLQRLEKKGYVASDRSGFAFVFRAIVSREELVHQRVSELAAELYDGQAAPLMLAFAQRQHFTPQELAELRRYLDELQSKHKRKKG